MKCKENVIYDRTIDFRAFFYDVIFDVQKFTRVPEASGYLVGFSETAPHVCHEMLCLCLLKRIAVAPVFRWI